jgi:hypothetical protein
MRRAAFSVIAILFVGFALLGDAQTCQVPSEMRPAINNLKFSEGAPGDAPPGWYLGPEWFSQMAPAHEAKTVSGSACNGGQQCATVYSIREIPSTQISFLYQVVDAAQYRGSRLTYRADVRADVAPGSVARLLVRVHRVDCSTSFRYDMGDHPITASAWTSYQLQAPIAPDARDIEFGVQLIGKGAAWIDNISMNFAAATK